MLKIIKENRMAREWNKQTDPNLLLIDIMDQISTYFNSGTIVEGVNSSNKKTRNTSTKKKRKIKPAVNPTIHKDKFATCKYCSKENFFWGETEWGWRLFDKDNVQHMCKETKNEELTTR